jgi:hypothetical protein
MSIVKAVRSSLGAKIALKLGVVALVLTAAASTVIVIQQTRQMERMTLDKARLAVAIGARQYGQIIDGAIDSGLLSVGQAFDRNYVGIKGHQWGKMPRFHSAYDTVLDPLVVGLLDKFLDYDDFVFAIGVDDHGYMPTHNSTFQKPFTDDPEKDSLLNRGKYLANHPVGLAAAQNKEPSLVQVYNRPTGETMWDVSSPIFARGRHWGAFRVGVSMERIAAAQRALIAALAGAFAIFLVVTIGLMFLVVQLAMKPVVALTAAADQISMGEALETPIKAATPDEIGVLTKTIDRLRISMKAAMARMGQ